MSRHTDHLSLRVTPGRTKVILIALYNKHNAESIQGYGEPGYQDPEEAVVFANWNNIPGWVPEYLEAAGFSIEWEDEWYIDYDYAKAYRTSGDSYHWQCQIHFTNDGTVLTPDDPASAWVEEFMNDPRKALPSRITREELQALDFDRYPDWDAGDFESGWHPGQTDDPKSIATQIDREFPGADVVFRLTEVSQFYLKFEAWYRKMERDDDET